MRSITWLFVFFVFEDAAFAQQALDAGYTAKIREYTTEPHFLTEIVDHLPASASVPTPEKVL
ncbi:MAG TPA: hypothetical protein VEX68_19405, partial [Bryobacteraceae bacterium]|nr:hypothetical protein [Bryobacteraceae bacterium]